MKKSVKAALWSAFAFPGAGHIAVRSYMRGVALLGATVGSIYYLVNDILSRGLMDKVNDVANKMLSGEIPADPNALERSLDLGPDPIGVQIASWLILACWIAGIVDSYRIGAQQDRAAAKPAEKVQAR